MSTAKKKESGPKKVGEMRMSGAMLGAGPGAMLDLPKHAVMVASLDHWGDPFSLKGAPDFEQIQDARLQAYVTAALKAEQLVRLYHPAPLKEDDDPRHWKQGVKAWEFPRWFVTQSYDDPKRRTANTRSRPLVHRKSLEKGKWTVEVVDPKTGRKRPERVSVVPVRFVRACVQGHIEDIDWEGFAHPNRKKCGVPGALRLEERGTSGDLAELHVVCTHCGEGAEQSLARATEADPVTGFTALGRCRGHLTWMGANVIEECRQGNKPVPSKLLVRSASNAWFPTQMSAITLPPADAAKSEAFKLVKQFWDDLFNGVEEASDLKTFRKNAKYKEMLQDFSDDALLVACQEVRAALTPVEEDPDSKAPGPKSAELDLLLSVRDHVGDDEPGSLFYAEPFAAPTRKGEGTRPFLDRVVLVHRLREVRALLGFTRFEALNSGLAGELDLDIGVRIAPLATHKRWVPAVENYGEGVFFSLDTERVHAWLEQRAVRARDAQLQRGFDRWRREHGLEHAARMPMAYVLLHSLSHLLITAVALECGYPASSIRERVYCLQDHYGVLLYTASPDAEGTLGGLVDTGRHLERFLQSALEWGRLCSNDPVCANHQPDNATGELSLQGAACHGCLLISETSCERRNTWLDRATVVPTVAHEDTAFFRGW